MDRSRISEPASEAAAIRNWFEDGRDSYDHDVIFRRRWFALQRILGGEEDAGKFSEKGAAGSAVWATNE